MSRQYEDFEEREKRRFASKVVEMKERVSKDFEKMLESESEKAWYEEELRKLLVVYHNDLEARKRGKKT
jgi:hypothetical protein